MLWYATIKTSIRKECSIKMYGCLLLCRTLTYAQKTERVLGQNGVAAGIVRPPAKLNGSSCSYAVRISPSLLEYALTVLDRYNLPPAKVFITDKNNEYREVDL